MKILAPLALACSLAIVAAPSAQAQWQCLYATYDDNTNGTGHNTTSVAVISENRFVALVMTRGVRNFMIPYVNADSAVGRRSFIGYGSSALNNVYQTWSDGAFDQVQMFNMFKITAASDGVVYGANNDAARNILVFKQEGDTVAAHSPYYRQETGTNPIFGIEVDGNGYVYVCNDTTIGKTDDIKIYRPLAQWTASHQDAPMRTIDLPDGIYKGITVTPDGSMIFVSDYGNRSILKYTGSPATGYTWDPSFQFALTAADTVAAQTVRPSILNLAYKTPENILFAASDAWIGGGGFYPWGRIYLINPYSGSLASADSSISIIDVAAWNFALTGGYQLRSGGTVPGNASGYTSTYDVEFDAAGNLYSQSHYGWTVEKWKYNGTLPTLSPTSVEPVSRAIPGTFGLSPNYPNPFNPATTLEFSVRTTADVRLEVFDLLGRSVALLVQGTYEPGTYNVRFDASGLPSGIYVARMSAEGVQLTQRMLLAR